MTGFAKIALLALALLLAASHAGWAEDKKPGDVFKDCDECPEMVVVPAGSFIMGSEKGLKGRELPLTKVTIAKPFAIGKYEVTFDEYLACHAAYGCPKKPEDYRKWGMGRRPVHSLTFPQMQAYGAWLTRRTGHKYRMPSEAEWEYAARAGTTTEYWFGDKMLQGQVNCRGCGTVFSNYRTAPVGTFKPNPWGLYDMDGNLVELVADCWNPSHEGAHTDGTARTDGNCNSRVGKGGGWYYLSRVARSASRVRDDIRIGSDKFGFRVVREIDPAPAPASMPPAQR